MYSERSYGQCYMTCSLLFHDQAHSVSELRKEKPQMCAFRTLLSILLNHCEFESNSSELTLDLLVWHCTFFKFL